MKTNDYLYAVAAIRANESALLKEADLEQLINAPDYKKATEMLADKGYELPDGTDYSSMLDKELEKTWELVNKSAPDADGLKALAVKNDFQNLKAILKAEVMGEDAKSFLVTPSVIDTDELYEKISQRRFEELPDFMSDAAKKAYDTITKTGNGQLCDIIVDEAALKAMCALAKSSGEELIEEYAQTFCLAADIKCAYRCAKTNKGRAFMESAVCECDKVNKQGLIEAALEGEEALLDFLKSNGLADYAQALENGTSAFEKLCDDRVLDIMKKAKFTAFGLSPISAFFVAKETELKCLRIILSAKLSNASNDVIRERMRELYV